MNDSPFKPGARVAVSSQWSDDLTESFVEKVHKSGNFTLRGSPQQWHPWKSGWSDQTWNAMPTGDGRGSLKIWDETTDAEIAAQIMEMKLKRRWSDIKHKITTRPYHPGEATCDAIEAALALVKS